MLHSEQKSRPVIWAYQRVKLIESRFKNEEKGRDKDQRKVSKKDPAGREARSEGKSSYVQEIGDGINKGKGLRSVKAHQTRIVVSALHAKRLEKGWVLETRREIRDGEKREWPSKRGGGDWANEV